jgi:hypothetical protein
MVTFDHDDQIEWLNNVDHCAREGFKLSHAMHFTMLLLKLGIIWDERRLFFPY